MRATNEEVQKEEDKQRHYLLEHVDANGNLRPVVSVNGFRIIRN